MKCANPIPGFSLLFTLSWNSLDFACNNAIYLVFCRQQHDVLVQLFMHIQLIAGGFTHLGNINTHIANFKTQLKSDTVPTKPLPKSVLIFMVRGLNSGLQLPYVQFPCDSLRGDQLFHLVWRVIGRLQQFGFHVMGLTGNNRHYSSITLICVGDGLTANRQMFRLHAPKNFSEIISNPFATVHPTLFFFLIPPPSKDD